MSYAPIPRPGLVRTPSLQQQVAAHLDEHAPVVARQIQELAGAHDTLASTFSSFLTTAAAGATGGVTGRKCSLCWDEDTEGHPGVVCANSHFICTNDCFASYVHSLCAQPYRIQQCKGEICCPVPDCTAPHFRIDEIKAGLRGHETAHTEYSLALDNLVEAAGDDFLRDVESTEAAEADASRVVRVVSEALSFKCPYPACRVILDPNPEGCCSMHCSTCGKYFCWLCFQPSGRGTDESHAHVNVCKENPNGAGLFVQPRDIAPVHRRRRLECIRLALLTSDGNSWRRKPTVLQAVQRLEKTLLADHQITADEIFDASEVSIITRGLKRLRGLSVSSLRDIVLIIVVGLLSSRGVVFLFFDTADMALHAHQSVRQYLALAFEAFYQATEYQGELLLIILSFCGILGGVAGITVISVVLLLLAALTYVVRIKEVANNIELTHSFVDECYFISGLLVELPFFVMMVQGLAQCYCRGDCGVNPNELQRCATGFWVCGFASIGYYAIIDGAHEALVSACPGVVTFGRLALFYVVSIIAVALLKVDYHLYQHAYSPFALAIVRFLTSSESWFLVACLVVGCANANGHE